MNRNHKVNEMLLKCDILATRYWQQGASGRGLAYKLWQNQIKKTVEFIKLLEKKCSKMA
jgi:hypothetical protein